MLFNKCNLTDKSNNEMQHHSVAIIKKFIIIDAHFIAP